MNELSQIGVLKAFETLVKERSKEVRYEADAQAHELFENDGITKRAIKLDGEKIGDFIVMLNKPTFEITNSYEFEDFALSNGFATVKEFVSPAYIKKAVELLRENLDEEEATLAIQTQVTIDEKWRDYMTKTGDLVTFMDTGEIVPGVEYVPETYKGTQLRGCKPEEVFPIVQRLGGIDQLLLGDGNE